MNASWARVFAFAAGSLSVTACVGSSGEGGEDGSETEGGTDTGGLEPAEANDLCDAAPTLSTGSWPGTLRGAASDLGGACGMGGPDAFLRVAVDQPADVRVQARGVGFVPWVGLSPGDCTEGTELACTQTLPAMVDDLPAGAELLVTVGIDPADPALASPAPEKGEPDPLAFEVDVLVRRILAVGDYCHPPSLGRCTGGSACLEDPEDGAWRCMALVGDSCADPQLLALPAQTPQPVIVELNPLEPQSDAHHHSCTGARLRERVVRVQLAQDTLPTADLVVRVTDPEVGLALRSPGCEAEQEIACDAPGSSTSVTFPNAGSAAALGVSPFVFVELPDPPPAPPDGGEPPDPIEVSFEIVDG